MTITWYICCIQYIYVIKNICLMTVTCYVCCAIYLCHDNLLLNDCSMICIFWCFSLCQNIKFKPAYTYMKMSLKQHGHFATNGFVFPLLSEMLQNTVKKNIYIYWQSQGAVQNQHTQILNRHLCIPDRLSVVQCCLGHVIWIVFFYTIYVTWNECAGQLAAGGVASVWKYWFRSPLDTW